MDVKEVHCTGPCQRGGHLFRQLHSADHGREGARHGGAAAAEGGLSVARSGNACGDGADQLPTGFL